MIKYVTPKNNLIIFLLIILLQTGSALAKYSGGDGTKENPWKISSKEDLIALGANTSDYGGYFVMTRNIYLLGQSYTQALISPIYPPDMGILMYVEGFHGVFDGNGFKIIGLTINGGDKGSLGLFGYVSGGEIRNLGFQNVHITSNKRGIGSLIGHNGLVMYAKMSSKGATILNCYSTGSTAFVSGEGSVGGLIGDNCAGAIINCYSTVSVSGTVGGVGGLVGSNCANIIYNYSLYGGGYISKSYFIGNVAGGSCVGGIVGYNVDSNISNCYASGSVIASGYSAGGLVGYISDDEWEDDYWGQYDGGYVSNCYFTGSVSGNIYAGGLIGQNLSDGDISTSYSAGTVDGNSSVGGLIGYSEQSNIYSCYSTSDVNAIGNSVGGLIGYMSDDEWEDDYYRQYDGGYVSECNFIGSVSGNIYAGGLIGENYSDGDISTSYSKGTVDGNSSVGGLIGYNEQSNIYSCYSTSDVNAIGNSVGGLVGMDSEGSILNSFSSGSVNGHDCVGGLLGSNFVGKIETSYSSSNVTGFEDVGGLVGVNDSNNVLNSFWDINTSGQITSAGGIGKTTAEMKKLSNFTSASWDFINTWAIGENQTHPYLRQTPASDINQDKKVDYLDLAILAENWLNGI